MKDYENFVARMGSFDMDLTMPETDQDVLNHYGVKGTYGWQNGGADYVRQNGSEVVSKVVTEINIAKTRRQLKQYL